MQSFGGSVSQYTGHLHFGSLMHSHYILVKEVPKEDPKYHFAQFRDMENNLKN